MKKTWIIIISCIAALLVIGGGILAVVLLGGNDEPAKVDYDGKLYWNVERDMYKDGIFQHRQIEDNVYRLIFAVDGEQVQLDVKGWELVREIDSMSVMGLQFDENGLVVDAYHVDECTGGYLFNKGYVSEVNGNAVTINSNFAFRGLSKTLELDENTQIYDVGGEGPLCGIPGVLSYNDEVVVIRDEEDNITHIYTKPYKKPGTVYWNIEKQYDSVNKITTREPDALMRYAIRFVADGEEVTLYCKDQSVVNQIDGARVMGLELDEEGYISKFQSVRNATNGGRTAGLNYYVSEIDPLENRILLRNKAVASETSTTLSVFCTDDYKVYDVSGNDGTTLGESTELQKNDRVICILDSHGRVDSIFVCHRYEGRSLYWNVDRAWDSKNAKTKRTPDENGWYYFKMAVNGEQVTVKTDSIYTANAIDKQVNVGLQLQGDVVTAVLSASSVHPGGVYASWYFVKEIREDGTIVSERTQNGQTITKIAKVAADCEFYNTSKTADMEGEKITIDDLKVGDTIHGYRNCDGEISILYLVSSVPLSHIYWNVDKTTYWDGRNKVSTRTPDSDGYYHIRLAVNGEQITVRTKDKTVVDDMDNRTCMGLQLYGDKVLEVYGATNTLDTQGGLFASTYHVIAMDGNKITAKKLSGSNAGDVVTATMKPGCQIYDVSNTATMVGEKSTVQVGDQIRGLLNKGKQISVLYVLSATNHQAHSCVDCGEDVVWLGWDGSTIISESGHYVLTSDITAEHGIAWSEDMEITLCLNGHKLTVNGRRVFSNVTGTLNIVDCVGSGHIHGNVNNNATITMVDGGTMNIYGGLFTAEEVTDVKNGGLFTILNNGTLNLHGGTVSGGTTNGYGGNINISKGTFNMYGGTVTGGKAKGNQPGGNIVLSDANSVMNMYGGTVENGNASSYGGNIAVTKTGASLNITGGTVKNGTAATHGGNIGLAFGKALLQNAQLLGGTASTYGSAISVVNTAELTVKDASVEGQIRVSGSVTMGGNVKVDDLLLYNVQLQLDGTLSGSVGISMETPNVICQGVDLTSICTSVDDSYVVAYEGGNTLLKSAGHRHCLCENAQVLPAGHTCENAIWEAVTGTKTLESGYYYLDFTTKAAAITVADGAHAHLCLNGAKVYAMKTITMGKGSTLDICDCQGGGQIGQSGNATRGAFAIDVQCTVNFYSGTINGTMNSNQKQPVTMNQIDARFNMYGGTITGGVSASSGGNVQIQNGQFHMYAGTITGGQSTTFGGNVAVTATNGSFYMYDGMISNGSATTHGGDLCASYGRFEMTGGTITGGTAKTNGGNITLVNDAHGIFTGGSVSGGTATKNGSCVYTSSKNMVIGGSVELDGICFKNGNSAVTVSSENPLTSDKVILITIEALPGNYSTVIKGCTDLSRFSCTTEGYSLQVNGANIVFKKAV